MTNRHSFPAAPAPGAKPGESGDRDVLPDSPCVAVCSTLFDEICRGCGRTADEVANWVSFSPERKREVWKRILAQGYPRRRG